MPTLNSVFLFLVLVAGILIFFDSLPRITQQFCKQTPLRIRVGVVLVAVGALAFLHDPLLMGGLFLIGRALLVISAKRERLHFLPRRTDSPRG
jgi:Na+/melibiose symporter-like transporter